MTQSDIEVSNDVGSAIWLKLVGAGFAIFFSFVGVLNVASVVGHYGWEWDRIIQTAIDTYRGAVYPFYETFLRPVFEAFGIRLTELIKDAITLLSASFLAANAESLIRDGRLLIVNAWNATWGGVERTMFHRFFGSALPWIIYGTVILATALHLCALVLYDLPLIMAFQVEFRWSFSPVEFHQSFVRPSEVPAWGYIAGIGSIVVGSAWLLIRVRSARLSLRSSVSSIILELLGALVAFVMIFLPLLSLLGFGVVAGGAMAVALLVIVSPIVAWRTVTVTAALFVALLVANEGLMRGWWS